MRKIYLILVSLFSLLCSVPLEAQMKVPKKIDRDTLYLGGKAVAYSETIWYVTPGDTVPDFTVITESGKRINIRDLRGKTVVVNFWIITCNPCMRELGKVSKEILEIYESNKFVFLGIGAGQTQEEAKLFNKRSGANFELCCDPTGKVMRLFSDGGCPRNFVVNPEGVITYMEMGYNQEKFSKLVSKIDESIKESKY